MALTPGSRLGVYEVAAPIGEGGMGQVWRATDTTLGRQVAIKILPDAFASDPERLARFEREAKTLASLNHPHIAQIYGFEKVDVASGFSRTSALVMELVEGEDLSQRLARGAIPLDEALPIARQIAEALEAAHEQGIIHRDLKPANIKVRPDGTVKVLDFGLAKAMGPSEGDGFSRRQAEAEASALPTITTPAMTQAGMILGTAAYMSPEQARGKAVDKRSDIWAFGVVLYEMLTATRLFAGDSVAETLGLIFSREPDLARLPAATPARVRTLIARCLVKDPRQRLRDIGEARLALEGAFDVAAPQTPAAVTSSRPRGRLAWMVTAAAVFAAAALGAIAGGRYLSPAAPPAATVRFEVEPPADFTLTPAPVASGAQLAISPDGRRLAFVAAKRRGVSQLWVRPLDSTEAQPIPGTEEASFPFWSPDGRSLAFFAAGKLKKVDTTGGVPQVLCDAASGRGGAWSTDGTVAFASINSSLMRVSASGGAVAPLTKLDPAQGAIAHYFPQFLPDGRHFLYHQRSITPVEHAGVYVGSLDSSETTRVHNAISTGTYSTGFLWFAQSGSLFAQAFDVRDLRTTGEPVRVADGLGYYSPLGYSAFTVSATGVLAFGPNVVLTTSVKQHGRGGATDGASTPPGLYRSPRLSDDQKSLAMSRAPADGGSDIWVLDLARRAMSRAVASSFSDWFPVWHPDNGRLYFGSNRLGSTRVYEKTLGGTDELFVDTGAANVGLTSYPTDISGDGRFLVFQAGTQGGYDLGVLPLAGERTVSMFLTTPFNEMQGRFSPNGRWMAYASDESGRLEVYVRPFPAASGQTQISLAGGMQPEWRRDGKELFYIGTDGKLTAVPVTTDGLAFTAGTRRHSSTSKSRNRVRRTRVTTPSPPMVSASSSTRWSTSRRARR